MVGFRHFAKGRDPKKSGSGSEEHSNKTSFEQSAYRAIKSAQRKKWAVILLCVFGAAAGIGLIVISWQQNTKDLQLAQEYAAIEVVYHQEALASQKKMETEKNFDSNLLEYPRSMELFAQFAKKYPRFPIGWQAAVRSATYYLSKKQDDKAQEVLESVIQYLDFKKSVLLQIRIRSALAGIYAAAKKNQKAIHELQIVEGIPENPFPEQARFLRAQILFLSGKKEEAQKLLNQIVSSMPEKTELPHSSQNLEIYQQAKIWLNYLES